MAILTKSGRAAISTAIQAQSIHLIWGSGEESWDDTSVPVSVDSTALVNEVGA